MNFLKNRMLLISMLLCIARCLNSADNYNNNNSIDQGEITEQSSYSCLLSSPPSISANDARLMLAKQLVITQLQKKSGLIIPSSIMQTPEQYLFTHNIFNLQITFDQCDKDYIVIALPFPHALFLHLDDSVLKAEAHYLNKFLHGTYLNDYRLLLVSKDTGGLVGGAVVIREYDEDYHHINYLYVAAAARKTGYGAALLHYCLRITHAHNKQWVDLTACPYGVNPTTDDKLVAWYKKHKFAPTIPNSITLRALSSDYIAPVNEIITIDFLDQ